MLVYTLDSIIDFTWLGSDEWNNGGTEGEVLKIEGGIQIAECEPRKDKSGSEWGRRWSVCK